jgi:methyl-accepting chemotaxis protein
MRRAIFSVLGALELIAACVLVYLAFALPSTSEVGRGFDRVEDSTRKASNQVSLVRREIVAVRRPELQRLADRLQRQTQSVSRSIKSQRVNFATVVSLRDSLRQVSTGLDGIADTLDAANAEKLGRALGDTASYINDNLLPATTRTADQFDKLAMDLSKDAEALSKLLRESPLDLSSAREIRDSLARFDDGLEKTINLIDPKRLAAVKEGFAGMETALDTTAGEVDKLAGYKYPHVKVQGLKVEVVEKPFWTNGEQVAQGLRKATDGVRAAGKEMEAVSKEMPTIRAALEESRKVVNRTRKSLDQALSQQDKLEPLLRDIPGRTAKLAEDLPTLTRDFAKALRETQHVREIADGLKETQKAMKAATAKWPEFRSSIKQTANLLSTSAAQLDLVVNHRDEYESSVQQSTELVETFAELAPLLADQLMSQLGEQEASLWELESSLDNVGNMVPTFKRSAIDVLTVSRLLIWLAIAALGLHGTLLLTQNVRPGVRA